MPPIKTHQSGKTTKLLFIGDSGAGKTGALASLAAAGYRLRIIDMDNGVDVLKNYLTDPSSSYVKSNPNCADNVESVTVTDPMKNLNGRPIPKRAVAWQRAIKLLDNWSYDYAIDSDGIANILWEKKDLEAATATGLEIHKVDLGPIASWGTEDILVVDSLSMVANAALNFHLSLNGALAATRTSNEGRRDIGATQNLIRDLLGMLYDDAVRCNVIVTSHVTFVSESGDSPKADGATGTVQGYPSAIGRALSPHIPRYFNNMLIARTTGAGTSAKHEIYTSVQNLGGQLINAKNASPLKVAAKYPLETGLADYFKAVRS